MKRKKTFKQLREDPVIKHPILAWLMDRAMLHTVVVAITVIMVAGFVIEGYQSLQRMMTDAATPSDYMEIVAEDTPAASWAASFVRSVDLGDEQRVSDSLKPTHGFLSESLINVGELPVTLIGSATAEAENDVAIVAQTFGAGQARKQFDKYVSLLGTSETATRSSNALISTDSGTIRIGVVGDALIALRAPLGMIDARFNKVMEVAETSLTESGCKALDADTDQSRRSMYYNKDAFTGLLVTEIVKTQVNLESLPNIKIPEITNIASPGKQKPEGPFPMDFPNVPENTPTKPSLTSAPEVGSRFQKNVTYRVPDLDGPGCGWAWSGQKPTVEDESNLKAEQDAALRLAQEEINYNAQEYVDSVLSWARKSIILAPQSEQWNRHTDKVNKVHEAWQKLEYDRVAIKPLWDEFLRLHEDWRTFPQRQADADKLFSEAQDRCAADTQELDEWNEENSELVEDYLLAYGDWEQSEAQKLAEYEEELAEWMSLPEGERGERPVKPEPTDPPNDPRDDRPAGCEDVPERPAILDQQRPPEPQPPVIPEDVTIPYSWGQPRE